MSAPMYSSNISYNDDLLAVYVLWLFDLPPHTARFCESLLVCENGHSKGCSRF